MELSLDTLRAELAGLELRLVDRLTAAVDKKADQLTVDLLEKQIRELELTLAGQPPDISKRLEALERFRYAVPGVSVLALAITIGSALFAYFG